MWTSNFFRLVSEICQKSQIFPGNRVTRPSLLQNADQLPAQKLSEVFF
jgi:hypothetical protein